MDQLAKFCLLEILNESFVMKLVNPLKEIDISLSVGG